MNKIKNVYEMIGKIDSIIKNNRLYNIKSIHSGDFNFQEPTSNQYDSFSPYFVDINSLFKYIKEEKILDWNSTQQSWGFTDENKNQYSMMNTEHINNVITGLFLDHGIFFASCFVSNTHIVFATHSKKLVPQIYETTFSPIKGNSNISILNYLQTLNSRLDFTYQHPQSKDFLLKIELDQEQNPNKHLRNFLKENTQFSIGKEYDDPKLFIKLKAKEAFNFDKFIYCMDETLSMHFFDTDPNIFSRASLIRYIIQHYEDIKNYLPNITEEEKSKLNRVFNPQSEEQFNKLFLLPNSIDLNNNKFYGQEPYDHEVFDADYGSEKLKNLINYIYLEMKIKDRSIPDQSSKRPKI